MGKEIVERIINIRRKRMKGKNIEMEKGVYKEKVRRIIRREKM